MISEELNTVLLLLTVILVKHLAYGVAAAGPIEKHPGSVRFKILTLFLR